MEAAENGLTHPEHVMTPTRNPSAGERARELLARANERVWDNTREAGRAALAAAEEAAVRRAMAAPHLREMPAIAIRAMAVRRARDAERAPRRPRSPFTRTRAARRPNEGMACPATGAEMAPSASEDAAEDVSESCIICMSNPRAVRFLPCRHAVMCEDCAMTEMKRTG